jgi:hypothetical protein
LFNPRIRKSKDLFQLKEESKSLKSSGLAKADVITGQYKKLNKILVNKVNKTVKGIAASLQQAQWKIVKTDYLPLFNFEKY